MEGGGFRDRQERRGGRDLTATGWSSVPRRTCRPSAWRETTPRSAAICTPWASSCTRPWWAGGPSVRPRPECCVGSRFRPWTCCGRACPWTWWRWSPGPWPQPTGPLRFRDRDGDGPAVDAGGADPWAATQALLPEPTPTRGVDRTAALAGPRSRQRRRLLAGVAAGVVVLLSVVLLSVAGHGSSAAPTVTTSTSTIPTSTTAVTPTPTTVTAVTAPRPVTVAAGPGPPAPQGTSQTRAAESGVAREQLAAQLEALAADAAAAFAGRRHGGHLGAGLGTEAALTVRVHRPPARSSPWVFPPARPSRWRWRPRPHTAGRCRRRGRRRDGPGGHRRGSRARPGRSRSPTPARHYRGGTGWSRWASSPMIRVSSKSLGV